VISIDPGRSKCGLAYVEEREVLYVERSVIPTESVITTLFKLAAEHSGTDIIIIGSGTGSRTLVHAIKASFPQMRIVLVDEKGTSLLARERYLKENPPAGWRRLLPSGMQIPKEPYDDYAALLLAERYLSNPSNR
jgi:RNase H-fold protein (predicted Holliday junction resolvase)